MEKLLIGRNLRHVTLRIATLLAIASATIGCGMARHYPATYESDSMYGVHNQEDIAKEQEINQFIATMSYDSPYGEKLLALYADEYQLPSSYASYIVSPNALAGISPIYWGSIYGNWGVGYRHYNPRWRGHFGLYGYNNPYSPFSPYWGWSSGYYYNPYYSYWDPFYSPYYSYGWGGWYTPYYYRPVVRPHYKRVNRSIVSTANPYQSPSSRSSSSANGATVGRSSSTTRSSSGYNRTTTTPTRSSSSSSSSVSRPSSSSSGSSSQSTKTNSIGR